jgi:uncharacterized protein YndB with AHSA1/START domain
MNTDRIEREVAISAPIDRVWAALTQPESVSAWFSNGNEVAIDLREGGSMVVDQNEHGVFQTVIVEVTPPHVFSFLWASLYPGVLATRENSTLVEFSLTTTGEGTLLRMVESGFDALPVPTGRVVADEYKNHSGGWTSVLAEFVKHVMAQETTSIVESP